MTGQQPLLPKRFPQQVLEMRSLQDRIGYQFASFDLLVEAMTHSSAARKLNREGHLQLPWNERLEFLGDAVLDLVLSDWLIQHPRGYPEGELSRMRSYLVNETRLSEIGRILQLGDCLILSAGEEKSGGRQRTR